MGGGFGGFKDFEDDKSPNTDEDLADDPLMQMDMAVRCATDVSGSLTDSTYSLATHHESLAGSLR